MQISCRNSRVCYWLIKTTFCCRISLLISRISDRTQYPTHPNYFSTASQSRILPDSLHYQLVFNTEVAHSLQYDKLGMTASKNQPKGQNNGKKGDTLDRLRYAVYMNLIVSGKTRPYLECFPPTERAAGFHIITAHLQIVQWKSIMLVCLHSEDYSWR